MNAGWLAHELHKRDVPADVVQDVCTLYHESQRGRPSPPTRPDDGDRCEPLRFASLSAVPRAPLRWLIEGWQLTSGHGVTGGSEKALKSWLELMKAVAVATGKPFLGEFAVPERRRVLYVSGEGGLDLVRDRTEHACRLYGVSLADLDGWLFATDQIAPVDSDAFGDGLRAAIAAHDPGLVIVDPAYVYVPADGDAGNVFKMGRLLSRLGEIVGQRALDVVHHMRKLDPGQEPRLTDLSQAGFREWAGHWCLLWHRTKADPEAGSFRLGVTVGGRRGFGSSRGLDVDLGRFDEATLQHEGTPAWRVVALDSGGDEDVVALLRAVEAGPLGVNEIRKATGWGAGKAEKVCGRAIECEYVEVTEGPNGKRPHVLTPRGAAALAAATLDYRPPGWL